MFERGRTMRAKPFRARERPRRDDPPLDGDASSGALRILDRALRDFAGRRLVPSAEVIDLLLDLRSAIMLDEASQELRDELEVH
jgi:hypothetical protein